MWTWCWWRWYEWSVVWHMSSFLYIYLCFTSIYCYLVLFTICTKEGPFKCCTSCVMTIEFNSRQRCRQGCDVLEQRENGDGEGRLAVCHSVPAGMELAFPLGREANARTAPLRPKQQQATAINSSAFQEALRLTDRADASHVYDFDETRVQSEFPSVWNFGPQRRRRKVERQSSSRRVTPPQAADPTGAGESRCAFVISSNIRCHWLSEALCRRPADGLPASRLWDATRFPVERLIVKMNNDVSAKNARVWKSSQFNTSAEIGGGKKKPFSKILLPSNILNWRRMK